MGARAKPQTLFARADLRAELARRTVRERISDKLASLVASGILQVGEELPMRAGARRATVRQPRDGARRDPDAGGTRHRRDRARRAQRASSAGRSTR